MYLGVGQLGKQKRDYMDAYWHHVVEATHARHVVAIHWDNFARPLDQPLQPIPQLLDDLETSMQFLTDKGRNAAIDVRLPQGWQTFDAFAP